MNVVPATFDAVALGAPAPSRSISRWLYLCCAMIAVMIVLGGMTRLTHSGLSIVEWKPVTGWLPPLNESQWQRLFDQYQHYPEFHARNPDMTVDGFKSIFWLEYLHRLWGRLIGIVFLLPLAWFLWRYRLERALKLRLGAVFVLGAMQGVLGWVMVMSGLVDRPDVSPYRLTAHLGLAFLLFGYLLWLALGLSGAPRGATLDRTTRGLSRASVALVCVTVLSGGFVAGTDAGFAYNTFPLMGGRLVPEHYWAATPAWRNWFENIAAVQFNHRLLAMTTVLVVAALWWRARPQVRAFARRSAHRYLGAALLQVALGITTLVLAVPLALGAAHQAGGLLLFAVALTWLYASEPQHA